MARKKRKSLSVSVEEDIDVAQTLKSLDNVNATVDTGHKYCR